MSIQPSANGGAYTARCVRLGRAGLVAAIAELVMAGCWVLSFNRLAPGNNAYQPVTAHRDAGAGIGRHPACGYQQ